MQARPRCKPAQYTVPRLCFRMAGEKFGHPARNEKNQFKKSKKKPTTTKIWIDKFRNQEIAAEWKLVVWASKSWWCSKKLKYFCETGGPNSIYGFTGAHAKFGGASACYSPLRPHLDFWGWVLYMKDPLRSPSSHNVSRDVTVMHDFSKHVSGIMLHDASAFACLLNCLCATQVGPTVRHSGWTAGFLCGSFQSSLLTFRVEMIGAIRAYTQIHTQTHTQTHTHKHTHWHGVFFDDSSRSRLAIHFGLRKWDPMGFECIASQPGPLGLPYCTPTGDYLQQHTHCDLSVTFGAAGDVVKVETEDLLTKDTMHWQPPFDATFRSCFRDSGTKTDWSKSHNLLLSGTAGQWPCWRWW